MTQQPDPFSELRGLKAELAAYRAGCIDARSWGGPTMYPPHPITEVRAGEMAKLLGALLDERDRLIEALTAMRTAGVYLCGCRARGAPKAFIPIAEQKFLDALDLARQALSQEIG